VFININDIVKMMLIISLLQCYKVYSEMLGKIKAKSYATVPKRFQ